MSKTFIVDEYKVAKVMEILLNQKMIIYNDSDKSRYGFVKTNYINRAYAQAKTIVETFTL